MKKMMLTNKRKIPEGWWQIPGTRGSNKEVVKGDAKALQRQITHKNSYKIWDTFIDYDPNFRAKAFLGNIDDDFEEVWLIIVNTPKPIVGINYSPEDYDYRKKVSVSKPKRKPTKKCKCK